MDSFWTTDQHLFVLPVIAALIGWVTNYLAVKMLFRPKRRVNLLLFSIQGVFPKRQKVLADRLGALVAKELFSAEDVKQTLATASKSDEVLDLVASKIEAVITGKLPQAIPMLAMVLTPELVTTVTGAFKEELGGVIDGVVSSLGESIDKSLDVHTVVEQKVAAFSSEKLEEMLFSIMKKEFRFIEFVGAVLGFFIGVVQVLLVKYPEFGLDLLSNI